MQQILDNQLIMISDDLLGLALGMFALIPLSYPIRFIQHRLARYAYSLLLGLALQIYVFGANMYPIYIQHLIVFAIIKLKGPKCGGIVTFQSMAALSGYHIYEFAYNYGGWSMNASALLMILVCKYSLLAYNLEDGQQSEDKLNIEQKRNRITHEITFLDYLGYLNFLPSSLVGPPLEYNDYRDFMELKAPYDNIPSVKKIVAKTLAETLFCAAIYIFGELYIPLSKMTKSQFYQNNALYIFFYCFISVNFARYKYYFGWKLSISAIHAAGVSYSGKDFKRINTVNPWVVETTVHVRDKISHWNISVQDWLRKCIYQRATFKNKAISQLYVFIISAFWHGFYAAYYISFFLWFSQVHLQGLIFKYTKGDPLIVKIYNKAGKAGHIILSILVQLLFTSNACYFLILDGPSCWNMMTKTYFLPQFIMFGLTIYFTVLPFHKKPKSNAKSEKKPVLSTTEPTSKQE